MGYIFSVISSIFFTLYIIAKKFAKHRCRSYTLFVGIGYFLCASITFVIMKTCFNIDEPWFDVRLLWATLGGVCWSIGLVLFMLAIDRIGVTRAGQYKNLQTPFGSLLILFVLSEYKSFNLILIFLAIISTLLGAICYSINEDKSRGNFKGVIMAVISAIFYSFNSLLRKMSAGFGFVYSQQAYTSLAIVVCLSLFTLCYKRKENAFGADDAIGLGAGISYYIASITLTLAYTYIAGTVAFTISQFCSVWITLCGIFMFHEISFKRHWLRISVGIALSILGIVLLAL